jgi:hypothetical protein
MSSEALRVLTSVLIILIGALFLWTLLSRVTKRARSEYESLLDLAQRPGAEQGTLVAAQRRLTALRLIVNAGRYGVVAVGLVLVLDQLDVRVTGLLLPAGFVGAALGVGAQNVVRDILAGLFFLFEAQFAVGDVVAINGVAGTVEEVGLRVTLLRDDQGQLHFFPNGAINSVARYPGRSVPLLMRLPLFQSGRDDELDATVRASHAAFAALFDRGAAKPTRMRLDQILERHLEPDGLDLIARAQADVAGTLKDKEAPPAPTAQTVAVLAPGAESGALVAEVAGPEAGPNPATPASPAAPAPSAAPAADALKAVDFAWWRWESHPARVALWRDKFPIQVTAGLRGANLEGVAGDAEVLASPADN